MLSPRSPAGRTRRREEQGCVLKRAGRGRSSPCRRGGDTDAAPLSPSLPPSLPPSFSGAPSRRQHPQPPSRAQAGTRRAAALQGRGWAGRARCPRCLRGGRGRTEAGGAGAARRTAESPPYPALHYSTHQAAAPPGPPPAVPAHDWLFPRRGGRSASSTGPRSCPSARGVEGRWQHGRGCGGVRRRRAEALRAAAAAPGPEQPGCAEPGPARLGAAQLGPEQPSSARSSPATLTPVRQSPARSGPRKKQKF
ncbi:uncharacterized protein GJ701_009213 isoform 1-T6 [Geothlypis trichas]